ncbi:MAG: FHA domain-containing protein [Verrucomicrobiia bacterium]
MYRLLFQDRLASREPLAIDRPSVIIGRHVDCHVQLAEPGVRDHHATIERRLDGYYLRGLDSPNGVYVNGQAITERRLASGDELEIGPVHLRFEIVHDGGAKRQRRPIDLLQVLAVVVVGGLIIGEIVLLGRIFSESRPKRVRLDVVRSASSDPTGAAGSGFSSPSASGFGELAGAGDHVAPAPTIVEPPLLNHVIRLARVERNDNGDVATVTIQAKAQAGERELNTAAVAIGVQFATVDGAGLGVDWRKPVWLSIPSWENFSTKTFTVRFPGAAHELVGFVVRTYYHRAMQDVAAVPPSMRTQAPIPTPEGSP